MNIKIILGIFIAFAIVVTIIIVALNVVKRDKIIIRPNNNKFIIALCGSCNGPEVKIGADVSGEVPSGSYDPAEFAKALARGMNAAAASKTNTPNEFSVVFVPELMAVKVFSNTKRSWTFKSTPANIYTVAGLEATVDKFWIFWNGSIENSTFNGKPFVTSKVSIMDSILG